MKKLISLLLLLVTFTVGSTQVHAQNLTNMTHSQCVNFQSRAISTSGSGNFNHCMRARCELNNWRTFYFQSSNMIRCTNGNTDFYTRQAQNGCTGFTGSCSGTDTTYCGRVVFFDCGRTSSGAPFRTTTRRPIVTTTTTTTRRVTTTTTTTRRPNQTTTRRPNTTTAAPTTTTTTTTARPTNDNNFLQSLTVSPGTINFNPLIEEYTLVISRETTSIEVNAVAEAENALVVINHHEEININEPITITVVAESGDVRIYTINLTYEEDTLTDSARIEMLVIHGQNLNFDPDVFTYNIRIGNETELDIGVVLENPNAVFDIIGNANLQNGSRIEIHVFAEDGIAHNTYVINIRQGSGVIGIIIVLLVLGVAGFVGFKLVKQLLKGKKEVATNYEYE